jgi:hypothetical protein
MESIMATHNFEVHIGLSKPVDARGVAAIPSSWKRDPVLELLSLKGAHEYEEHNVEGKLMTLMTRHAASMPDVQDLVSEAAGYCRGEASARIEIEQVLVSCGRDLAIGPVDEFAFVPTNDAFPNLQMIRATPPYEVHYCLAWDDPADAPSMADVATVCADASIGIDELVEFGGDKKITTTKFYRKLDRMIAELAGDATAFLAALDRSALRLRYRLIAERIITCGIPV